MSNILILGGDGYLGWPAAMYFSNRGHKVTVVDNYFRRHVGDHINAAMLYPVPTLIERAKIWYKETGYEIRVIIGDLTDPELMRSLFSGQNVNYDWSINNGYAGIPDTVIHYAEQPSAPYSLMNYKTANFTITNNLLVTNNLLFAIRDLAPDVHIIKLALWVNMAPQILILKKDGLILKAKEEKINFFFHVRRALFIILPKLWIQT